MNRRDSYCDFLKGLAIICVVFGHTISNEDSMLVPYNIIYSFHMPLFFFISAYVEELHSDRYLSDPLSMLKKRAVALLVPYVSWTILEYLIRMKEFSIQTLLHRIIFDSYWFLAVLFILKAVHMLYMYIQRYYKKTGRDFTLKTQLVSLFILEVLITGLALITHYPYLINSVTYAIPYMLGILCASRPSLMKLFGRPYVYIPSAIAYIALFQFFSFKNTAPSTQIIRIVLSLFVIVLLFAARPLLMHENRVYRLFVMLGNYSLGIYLMHGNFLQFHRIYEYIREPVIGFIAGLFLSLVCTIFCALLTRLILAIPYVSFILMGKTTSGNA